MNKSELINAIAQAADLTVKAAEDALGAFMDNITQALKKGEQVTLIGFGTFGTKHRAARMGRNPSTGKELQIPATTVAYFKPGAKLKEEVNGGKK